MFIDKNLEMEAYFQAFHHAPIGMALVGKDGQWLHSNENGTFRELLTFSRDIHG